MWVFNERESRIGKEFGIIDLEDLSFNDLRYWRAYIDVKYLFDVGNPMTKCRISKITGWKGPYDLGVMGCRRP